MRMLHRVRYVIGSVAIVLGAVLFAWWALSNGNTPPSNAEQSARTLVDQPDQTREPPTNSDSHRTDEFPPLPPEGAAPSTDHALSTEQLLADLIAFASAKDQRGCESIYQELKDRPDAAEKSSARLRLHIENTSTTDRHVLFYLAILAPESAFADLLEALRSRWTRENQDAAKRWDLVDMMNLEILALRAVEDEYDIALCDALVFVIERLLHENRALVADTRLATISDLYRTDIPDREMPDPWLSQVLTGVVRISNAMTESSLEPLRRFASRLAESHTLSARLRIQARTSFIEVARGLYEVLDQIAASESVAEAGAYLGALLKESSLTAPDWTVLLEVLNAKFGMERVHEVCGIAFTAWPGIRDVNTVRQMAADICDGLAARTDDAASFEINLIMRTLAVKAYTQQVRQQGPDTVAAALFDASYVSRDELMRRLVRTSSERKYAGQPATQHMYDITLYWTLIDSGIEYEMLVDLLTEHSGHITEWQELYTLRVLEHIGRHRMTEAELHQDATRALLLSLVERDGRCLAESERGSSTVASLPRGAHFFGQILLTCQLLDAPELTDRLRTMIECINTDSNASQRPLYAQYCTTIKELRALGIDLPK